MFVDVLVCTQPEGCCGTAFHHVGFFPFCFCVWLNVWEAVPPHTGLKGFPTARRKKGKMEREGVNSTEYFMSCYSFCFCLPCQDVPYSG